MALYAIGDLHLSPAVNKSMEVFGPAWEKYVSRIESSLSQLTAEDVLILAGGHLLGIVHGGGGGGFPFPGAVPLQKDSRQGKPRLLVVHGLEDEGLLHGEKGFTTLGLPP